MGLPLRSLVHHIIRRQIMNLSRILIFAAAIAGIGVPLARADVLGPGSCPNDISWLVPEEITLQTVYDFGNSITCPVGNPPPEGSLLCLVVGNPLPAPYPAMPWDLLLDMIHCKCGQITAPVTIYTPGWAKDGIRIVTDSSQCPIH
jgi:hypothetical protein